MKWNKKVNTKGVPRVYESKERAVTRWPDGKIKRAMAPKLLIKCGDCDSKFTVYAFGMKGVDEKNSNITHKQDTFELNGVLLTRAQMKKILKWVGY